MIRPLPSHPARLLRAAAALAMVVVAAADEEVVVPRVQPVPLATPSETYSTSQQFTIHGPDAADRGRLAVRVEEIREEFVRLVDRAESASEKADPLAPLVPRVADRSQGQIDVWVRGDARLPVEAQVYRLSGAERYTLGVVISHVDQGQTETFRQTVIRLLLAERIIRDHGALDLSERGDVLPPWLEAGVLGALDHLRIREGDTRFADIFNSGRILSVGEVLTARPATMTEQQREIFRASACCLVLALVEQPEGPRRFREFLAQIPVSTESVQTQLTRKFPGLALSRHSLEKWWTIQLAQLAQPTVFDVLTPAETEEQLAKALTIHYQPPTARGSEPQGLKRWLRKVLPGGNRETTVSAAPAEEATPEPEQVYALADWEKFARLPEIGRTLEANQSTLTSLQVRAFPLHRPLIEGYQEALSLIARGKTKSVPEKLAALDDQRRTLLQRLREAESYLDWFEATQRPDSTGQFDDFFRRLDSLEPKPTPRTDPISKYLDQIEAEYR